MSDFAPPTGPPPPKVPEGWKAVWNDQYKEWFYVNLYTKQSQWDKPETPAVDPNASHSEAPPNYMPGSNAPTGAGTDTKSQNLYSNNPYAHNTGETDEALARRLQEEENQRNHGSADRGANDSYYQATTNQGYPSAPDYGNQPQHQQQYQQSYQQQQQQQPSVQSSADRGSKSGGFFSKIKDKVAQSQGQRPMGAPMMGYNAGGYPPQGYNNYPQQHGQYGGYPQQGYGQYGHGGRPMMGMGPGMGGYPHKKKGGMGMGGAAALGVGGGLLGGMLIADQIDDMQEDSYDQGFEDGGGDDGGD